MGDADRWILALENAGIRPGLERMRALFERLGLGARAPGPPTIHVAGTNGKSSTTLLCAAMLEQAGLRTGAYVSPHVVSFADRVRVGGAPLGEEEFAACAEEVRRSADALDEGPGQFEALTAIALLAFARAGVAARVLECGLGGRLDATNAVRTDVQVLTSVGLDHQAWLGETLEAIAAEKLAIVEEGGTLVVGPGLPDVAADMARATVAQRGARLVEARPVPSHEASGTPAFQRANLGTALAATRALLGDAAPSDDMLVAAAAELLPLAGRLEPIGRDPLTVVDAAHNAQAVEALLGDLDGVVGRRPVVAVVALLDDKDPAAILDPLVARCPRVVATTTRNPRSLGADAVAAAARGAGAREVETAPEPAAAVARARTLAGPDGAVLVTGTTSLVRDLRDPSGPASRSRF